MQDRSLTFDAFLDHAVRWHTTVGTIDSDVVLPIVPMFHANGQSIPFLAVEIENIVMEHPAVACAAVVAIPHERWGERTLLVVELTPAAAAAPEEFLTFTDGRIARCLLPDALRIAECMPLGATGKVDRRIARRRLDEVMR